MPTYELTDDKSGQSFQVDFDKTPSAADMDEVMDHYRSSRTSAAGAFGRGAATSVVPAFGAWGGAEAGAGIGEFGGPIGAAIGAGIGAIAGSVLADKAQSKALQTLDPEAYNHLSTLQSEDIQQHPIAARAGEIAGGLPAFRIQNPMRVAAGVSALSKIARGKFVTPLEQKAAKYLAMQTGFGAAVGAISPALVGRKPTVGDITQGIAQSILFGTPRFSPNDYRANVRTMDNKDHIGKKGESHNDIIEREKLNAEDVDRRDFINLKTGQRFSREQLAKLGVKGVPGSVPGAHSTGLTEAQQKEENASRKPSAEGVPQLEVRPQVGEETPLRQQGKTPRAQKAVAKEAQVPLTKDDYESAGNLWNQASGAARSKLVGKTAADKMWIQLTGEEQEKAARKLVKPKPQTRPAAKTEDIIKPEHQQMLDIERGNVLVPVETLTEDEIKKNETSDDPFAQLKGEAMRNNIAFFDRDKKRIVLNPQRFNQWMDSIPPAQRQKALRSLLAGEEITHGATSDAAAKAYLGTLTGLERHIHARMYLGPRPKDPKGAAAWDSIKNNDVLLGHEALAYRMQQLMGMTPRVMAEAIGREKWTLKSLAVLESTVRGIRETLGTKASAEAIAILDHIHNRIQLGKFILGNGTNPGAINKKVQETAEQEAQKLDEQARMYLESGDVESAQELQEMAKKLRGQTGEQYFPGSYPKYTKQPYSDEDLRKYSELKAKITPTSREQIESPQFQQDWADFERLRNKYGGMPPAQEEIPGARPKKRQESIFQEKFILPEQELTKGAGLYRKEETAIPPEQRASAEASGALPRLPEEEIQGRAASWIGNSINEAMATSEAGKRASVPDFDDFRDYMKKQAPHYGDGRLFELWQNYLSNTFDDMPGDQLQKLAKGVFAPQTSLAKVEQIARTAGEIQPLFQTKRHKLAAERERTALQPGKEAGKTIWNRPVPDKPGPDSVIQQFREAEREHDKAKEELAEARSYEPMRLPGEKSQVVSEAMVRAEADSRKKIVSLKKAYEEAMRAQSWRRKVVAALFRKTVKPALEESDARLERKTITPEEIRYGAPHAYEDISKAPTDTAAIRDLIADGSRRSRDDSAAVTKRFLVLLNPRSGTVHIVSAYEHPGMTEETTTQGKTRVKDIRVLDPISPTKESVPFRSIANRYKLLYTGLLDEPVRKFRQDFKSLSEYNEDFGKEASERNAAHESYEPLQISESEFMESTGGRIERGEGGSFMGPHKHEVLGETGEGELEGAERTPLTDAEASAIFDHIINEVGRLDSPADVEAAMSPEAMRRNRQAAAGLYKMVRKLSEEYPFATAEELRSKVAERVYDAHKSAKSLEDFQKKLGVYQKIQVPPEAPSKTSRELTTLRSRGPTDTGRSGRTGGPPQEAPPSPRRAPRLTKEEYKFVRRSSAREAYESAAEHFGRRDRPTGRMFPKPRLPEWYSRGMTKGQRVQEFFPGARPKQNLPTESFKTIARATWKSLGRLFNARDADVEAAFPQLEGIRDMIASMPPDSPRKVSRKLEEEVVLGHSDIKLTPNEQKFYDTMADLYAENQDIIKAIKKVNPDMPREYFPRMLQDPNSLFERIVRGAKTYVTEGSVLSRSAWFTRPRTIRAIEDDQGNRRVVAIVKEGEKGKLVAYDKGQAEDMGPYAFTDVIRRGKRLEQEIAPIKEEVERLFQDIHMLERTPARAAASKRLILQKRDRLAELYEEAENIAAKYPDDTLEDRTWLDKNGKEWRVTEATTSEIESNMRARFYHNAYALLLSQNLKLKQMLRNAEWMEEFKQSPEFQMIASVGDQPGRPTDWRLTALPQMKGIWFQPRLADVLDQFHEQSTRGDTNAWRNINRALQGALFLNQPFLHDPNLLTWWFATRGASQWLMPSAYPRMYRTFARAFHDVLSKNGDYSNYLRLGTPLQLKRMSQFGDTVTRMLRDELEGDPPLARKISNALGFLNPIHLMNTVGRAATEGLHDILTLQLIHELEERGMMPHEALHKVTAIMPDRRIPPRVLGSRWLSRKMDNSSILWFAAYHYSEGKAFSNLVKGVAGRNPDVSRAEALDKIAAIALLMFAAYPALDALIKEVTGKNYAFRRAGPTTWPSAIKDVVEGRKTPAMVTPSFVSLSPVLTGVVSALANRNLMNRGLPIYNPRAPLSDTIKNLSLFAGQTINPIQMYGDLINGRTTFEDITLNLLGIKRDYANEPYNQIYGWAYDWAKATDNKKLLNRFNMEANEVYPPSIYGPLKRALADGSDAQVKKELAKLMARDPQHPDEVAKEVERELRPGSHPLSGLEETESDFYESLNPEQRQVYDTEMNSRQSAYQRYLELSGQ